MTTQLTILTPFADLAELIDNFSARVDEERLMLPCAAPQPDGTAVVFSVLLADGTPAMNGEARVQSSFDNGADYPEEYRFDVVLEALALDELSVVLFERLLMARGGEGADPPTGEVSIEALEAQAAAQAAAQAQAAEIDDGPAWEERPDEATRAFSEAEAILAAAEGDAAPEAQDAFASGDAADDAAVAFGAGADEEAAAAEVDAPLEAAEVSESSDVAAWADEAVEEPSGLVAIEAEEVEPAPAVPAFSAPSPARPAPRRGGGARRAATMPTPHAFGATLLTRTVVPASWTPQIQRRPPAARSTGAFDGVTALASPARLPLPDLDPSGWVRAAPSAAAPWFQPQPRKAPSPRASQARVPVAAVRAAAAAAIVEEPSSVEEAVVEESSVVEEVSSLVETSALEALPDVEEPSSVEELSGLVEVSSSEALDVAGAEASPDADPDAFDVDPLADLGLDAPAPQDSTALVALPDEAQAGEE